MPVWPLLLVIAVILIVLLFNGTVTTALAGLQLLAAGSWVVVAIARGAAPLTRDVDGLPPRRGPDRSTAHDRPGGRDPTSAGLLLVLPLHVARARRTVNAADLSG